MQKVSNFISTAFLELKLKSFDNKQELVLVTGSDSSHYKSLCQLLNSIKTFEKNAKTVVFDLGLTKEEHLSLEQSFDFVDLRKFDYSKYQAYFNIKSNAGEYAWKPVIVHKVLNEFKCSVCWIDAGNVITQELKSLRKVIEYLGFYSPFSKDTIADWTHYRSLEILEVSNNKTLLKQTNLNGACIAVNYKCEPARVVVEKWKDAALNKKVIAPEGSSRANHRQDQAILSVLAYKHIPEISKKMTFKKFGFKLHQDID